MEILAASGPPETKRALVVRSSPLANLSVALFVTALVGGMVWGLAFRVEFGSGLTLLLMTPLVGIVGLIMLLVFFAAWSSFRSSLRPSNWSWVVREREVFVNLRDYRNANPGESAPALRLEVEDLKRAQVVLETYKTHSGTKVHHHREKSIDLYVKGLDAEALETVLREEREHPGRVGRSGKGRTKFKAQPIRLLGADGLRFPYSKRLQFCLEHVVPFDEPARVALEERWKGLKPLERALELHGRGHEFAACKLLVGEEDLSHKEAERLIADALAARDQDAA